MKKLFACAVLGILYLSFSSCYSIVFSSMGVLDTSASEKKAVRPTREIVYIPMHHIGKQEFYTDVKNRIDSLRRIGFVIYFEGTKFSRENDSLKNDTIAMKIRKVIGLDLRTLKNQGGYIDTLNNTLMGLKIRSIAKYKLVNQPKSNNFFDTTIDRRVDVYMSDVLQAFEEKYGNVPLDECDFKSKPGEKYTCKKYKHKEGKQFMILDERNKFIANEIIKDNNAKIALIYGAKHFEGILKYLQQQDSSWKSL